MRMSYWLGGVWAIAGALCVCITAGCSNGASFGGPGDSGSDATGTTATDAGGDASCAVPASTNLSLFAAEDASGAACATCVLGQCNKDVLACERNCSCVAFFTCVSGLLDAGAGAAGMLSKCTGGDAGVAALESNSAILGLYGCYSQTCASECMPGVLDGGTSAESGSPESGTPESGSPESGSPESGSPESGSPESGTPDGGGPEGGAADTGADADHSG